MTYLNFIYLRFLLILCLYGNNILTYTLTQSLIDINTQTRTDTNNKTTQKVDLKLQSLLMLMCYGFSRNGKINYMYIANHRVKYKLSYLISW